MSKVRKAIAVIGEGITEKYYIESIKGLTNFQIYPKELSKDASSISKLDTNIAKLINSAYDEIYCLIDMDGKKIGKTHLQYKKIKEKYHGKIHGVKKNGIQCKVTFIETERCTELWFLYHFTKSTITKKFNSYSELEKELKKYLPHYEKKEKYFKRIVSLHDELTKKSSNNGALSQAIVNANNSIISKESDGRDYTYCEMHILIDALGIKKLV